MYDNGAIAASQFLETHYFRISVIYVQVQIAVQVYQQLVFPVFDLNFTHV